MNTVTEYTLFYKPTVIAQLKKLPLVEKKKIVKKLEYLQHNPSKGKRLKGELGGLRSLRAWPYRIIYEVSDSSITVLSVAHRKDVYR